MSVNLQRPRFGLYPWLTVLAHYCSSRVPAFYSRMSVGGLLHTAAYWVCKQRRGALSQAEGEKPLEETGLRRSGAQARKLATSA